MPICPASPGGSPIRRLRADAHLVLVGLPGAGKTTVGRAVAAEFGRPFIDLDAEIERHAGRTIAEIFRAEGEEHFRKLEVEATRGCVERREPLVVSAGGGWASNSAAVALLSDSARIIFLRVSPETALARLGPGVAERPLLAGRNPLAALRRLSEAREGHYSRADVILDAERIDRKEVTDLVVRLVRASGGV